MARKHDDAVAPAAPLDDAQVAQHLRSHPDFLLRHPELMTALTPPSRFEGADGVIDLQVFMIERLREEIDRFRGAAETLIHTSRSNMSTQERTHRAVLVLLAAENMEEIAEAVSDDLPPLLDVDVATLCFEHPRQPMPELSGPRLQRIDRESVSAILGGRDRDCALTEDMPGDPQLFAEAAPLVRSSAAVRVAVGGTCPPGLLCLGSREERTFHPGQATDLLSFLARVVESCVRRFIA